MRENTNFLRSSNNYGSLALTSAGANYMNIEIEKYAIFDQYCRLSQQPYKIWTLYEALLESHTFSIEWHHFQSF